MSTISSVGNVTALLVNCMCLEDGFLSKFISFTTLLLAHLTLASKVSMFVADTALPSF